MADQHRTVARPHTWHVCTLGQYMAPVAPARGPQRTFAFKLPRLKSASSVSFVVCPLGRKSAHSGSPFCAQTRAPAIFFSALARWPSTTCAFLPTSLSKKLVQNQFSPLCIGRDAVLFRNPNLNRHDLSLAQPTHGTAVRARSEPIRTHPHPKKIFSLPAAGKIGKGTVKLSHDL